MQIPLRWRGGSWIGLGIVMLIGLSGARSSAAADKDNRLIDYKLFESQVAVVGDLRATHRVSEAGFLRMAADSATVILDARSAEKFALLHVKGARNLSLPDMTEEELARIIPSKDTRILIYCNNNFLNSPKAFPSKAPSASLNLHSFNALYSYGYRNVFELQPLLDIHTTKLPFEGSEAAKR